MNNQVAQSVQFRSNAVPTLCGWREGLRHFRSFIVTAAIVGSVGYLLFQFARDQILGNLPRLIEGQLNQALGETGWRVSIGRAEWGDDASLQLGQVQLFPPDSQAPMVALSSMMIEMGNTSHPTAMSSLSISAIRIERDIVVDMGVWRASEWEKLSAALMQFQGDDRATLPGIELTDVGLQINDSMGTLISRPRTFHNLHVRLSPHRELTGAWVGFAGVGACDESERIEFSGFVDPQSGVWQVAAQARQFLFHEGLLGLVPRRWQHLITEIELFRGRGAIDVSASSSKPSGTQPQVEVRIDATDVAVFDRRWAQPLLGGSMSVRSDFKRLDISQIRGRLGTSEVALDRICVDLAHPETWQIQGAIRGLEFNPQWLPLLPPEVSQMIQDLDPHGVLDLVVDISSDHQGLRREIQANLKNLDFCFRRFPFRLNHGVGTLSLVNDQCEFSVQALEQGQVVTISGWADRLGPQGAYQVDFESLGDLAIDQKLFTALEGYPRVAAQVRATHVEGRFNARGRFYKLRGESRPALDYDIHLAGCSVRHAAFPYLVRDVTGVILVRGDRMTLHQVVGHHLGSRLTCDGGWSESEGLTLRVIANDVPLDRELRNASPPTIQQVWDAVQPQGAIDLARVDLRQKSGESPPDVRITLEIRHPTTDSMRAVSIQPVAFPYRWEHVEGTVEIAEGQVSLRNLRARHGRTSISCEGRGQYGAQGWWVGLEKLWATAIKVDDELLNTLPETLAVGLRSLDYRGLINLSGRVGFGQVTTDQGTVALVAFREPDPGTPPRPTQMQWDVRLDLDQGQMKVGVPVEHVFGAVVMRGEFDGREAVTTGEVALESATICNMQCTNIRGPIRIDSNGAAVGRFALPGYSPAQPNIMPLSQPWQCELFGGRVVFDGKTFLDRQGMPQFYFQVAGDQMSVKKMAASLAPHNHNLSGTATAQLRLSGRADRPETIVGEGRLEIKQAQLYELPLFVALLRQLLRPDKSAAAFDTCRVDFTVQREQINLQRMELVGDALSLLGNGQINFHRQVDLNFFTVAGRNRFYIPIVSELYEMGSQQILWITVNGTLDQPKTNQVILPQMNDMLKQLLGEPRE